MANGLAITSERGTAGTLSPRGIFRALCGFLFYIALWGGLSSMAYLSMLGLVPLTAGGVFLLLLSLVPGKRRGAAAMLGGAALIAALLILLRREVFSDGCKFFLNRLFTASEERQAYEYDYLAVSAADGISALRYALIPLGILSGLLCGLAARYALKWLFALMFAAFCAAAAWLGVSPAVGWMILLLLAVLPPFLEASALTLVCGVLPAALICTVLLLAFPGENARLSAWDETMRDRLASATVAYTDRAQYAAARRAESAVSGNAKQFYQEEETDGDTDGDKETLSVPFPVLLAILITALLLFVPAIYSDRLKKRRAKNRAGLDDPDHGISIRAAFLCAMRWLAAGGLSMDNRPYGDYAPEIERSFSPELRADFERVLPLWREAAYSAHTMEAEQRAAMLRFFETVQKTVWNGLGKRARLRVRYIDAL